MYDISLQLLWLRIHVPKYSAAPGDPLSILNFSDISLITDSFSFNAPKNTFQCWF